MALKEEHDLVVVLFPVVQIVLGLNKGVKQCLSVVLIAQQARGQLNAVFQHLQSRIRISRGQARKVVVREFHALVLVALKRVDYLGGELVLVGNVALGIEGLAQYPVDLFDKLVAHLNALAHLGLVGILAQVVDHAQVGGGNISTGSRNGRTLRNYQLSHHVGDVNLAPAIGSVLELALQVAHSRVKRHARLQVQKVCNLLFGTGVVGALAVERHLVGTAQRGANVLVGLSRVGNVVGLGKDGICQLGQGLVKHVGGLGGADVDDGAVHGHAGVQHGLF